MCDSVERLNAAAELVQKTLERMAAEHALDGSFEITVRFEFVQAGDMDSELCPVVTVKKAK